MNVEENMEMQGDVEIIIQNRNGEQNILWWKNAILTNAKEAQANALCNNIGQSYQFYIEKMIFGTNGQLTVGGARRTVSVGMNGLFGSTLVSKNVLSTVNPQKRNQAIFTAVIGFEEGNGSIINEMALVMKNGDLFSMVTSGGISKDSSVQFIVNWRISSL